MTTLELDQMKGRGEGAAKPSGKLNVGEAFHLQMTPGLANFALFVPAAWFLHQAGLSVLFALGIGILFGEVPVAWWIMIKRTRAEHGRFSFAAAFPWMRPLSWKFYLGVGVPLMFVSLAMMFTGQMILGPLIHDAAFSWVPPWMTFGNNPAGMMGNDTNMMLAMWAVSIVVFTIIGGITQELYSRGFLLPRMAHWGIAAPILNAAFFAMLHIAAPWGWPVFFATSLIWALAVYYTRSVKIGLVGHVGMLALQSVMFGMLIMRTTMMGEGLA